MRLGFFHSGGRSPVELRRGGSRLVIKVLGRSFFSRVIEDKWHVWLNNKTVKALGIQASLAMFFQFGIFLLIQGEASPENFCAKSNSRLEPNLVGVEQGQLLRGHVRDDRILR